VDPDRARELLQEERTRLERALGELAPPARDGDRDPAEAGDVAPELLDAEIDAGLAEPLREQLAALGRAEARLAEGSYGISIESGEPIPDGRLESIPWAERTAEEQSRYDSRGG
jgi:DnaK suppressor protein